jgi:hypothetical protein
MTTEEALKEYLKAIATLEHATNKAALAYSAYAQTKAKNQDGL